MPTQSFQVFDDYFVDNAFREGFSMYPILTRPLSRGRIKLRSSDPSDYPIIEPNYLSDLRDVKTLIEGKVTFKDWHRGELPSPPSLKLNKFDSPPLKFRMSVL